MKSLERALLSILFFVTIHSAVAADPKYPVSAIHEELKKNMYAVIREEETVFEILNQRSSIYHCRKVITILNANAKDYAIVAVSYDKNIRVESFKANVYDGNGVLIKKLKQSEILDNSSISGFSLYEDDRIKYADLSQSIYPYTIEFEYEVKKNFLFSIPGFSLGSDDEISIQTAKHTIIYPTALKPRYKCFNIKDPEKKMISADQESLTWAFADVKPVKFESLSNAIELMPRVIAAPDKFEYDGYIGTMNSWKEFGQWIMTLNEGRNILPEETKKKVRQLTQNLKTPEEKVKVLYEYMQNKTRYVSIQLGIGGLQPFEASTVDQTGYGDCKALSNYMVSILDVAGIKANYTLINAGENELPMETDFPSSQFNHAVVFVPVSNDTIWLECTSQTNPFGYMGTSTTNRKALAITDKGGEVVRTPKYSLQQNTQSRSADVYIEPNGNAKGKVRTNYSGLEYENGNLDYIVNDQYDDQKKWLQKNINIPSFDINTFSITCEKNKIPTAHVAVDLTLNRFATINGKRMFITPNLMNKSTFTPEKLETRRSNVVLKYAYIHFDTIRYHLPEGIYPEFVSEPIKLQSVFGEYESGYKLDGDTLLYIRRFKRNNGTYSPQTYQSLIDFYRNVNKADNSKMVFLSKT